MASFRDILNYYQSYRGIALFSIAATSIFEILDLFVPYVIGQILNVLSDKPVDRLLQNALAGVATLTNQPVNQFLSLTVLLGFTFFITVVRAPIQPWISSWFHWDIALRSRREHGEKVVEKILTMPLEFYDENN